MGHVYNIHRRYIHMDILQAHAQYVLHPIMWIQAEGEICFKNRIELHCYQKHNDLVNEHACLTIPTLFIENERERNIHLETIQLHRDYIVIHTLIDGGPLECESSARTDELFSSTTITS